MLSRSRARVLSVACLFVACGSSAKAPASKPVPGPIDGTLRDSADLPVAGAAVQIGEEVTTTDADGRFHVGTQPATYDIAIVTNNTPQVQAYLGMTTRTPTIRLPGFPSASYPSLFSATIAFMPPAGFGATSGFLVSWSMKSADAKLVASGLSASDPARIAYFVTWTGNPAPTVAADLFLTEIDSRSGAPGHYVGYQHLERLVRESDPTPTITAELGPMPFAEKPLFVHGKSPADMELSDATIALQVAPNGLPGDFVTSYPSFGAHPVATFLVPDIPGATLTVNADAQSSNRGRASVAESGVAIDATSVTFTFPDSPTIDAPDDGAIDIDTTTDFAWTMPAGSVGYLFAYAADTNSIAPSFTVYTASGHAHLPDVSKLGVTLPKGAAYEWAGYALSVASTLDDFVARPAGASAGTPNASASTEYRTFTTR